MSHKNPIEIEIADKLNIKPDCIYEAVVVKNGNGASIKSYKRHIGKKATIIIHEETP